MVVRVTLSLDLERRVKALAMAAKFVDDVAFECERLILANVQFVFALASVAVIVAMMKIEISSAQFGMHQAVHD